MNTPQLMNRCAILLAVVLCCSCASTTPTADRKPVPWRTVKPLQPQEPPNENETGTEKPYPRPNTEYFGGPVERPTPTAKKSATSTDGKRIDLNFQEAEARSVVDVILGDILKVNYTIAPQVQGKLTLRTGRPVASNSLLSVLETSLLAVSATMIEQDGVYQVIPLEAAPQRVVGARKLDYSRLASPGYAIEIVPLRYVSAGEMQKILESFAPKGSVLQADNAHNQLILAGTSQERSSMMRTIDAFDVDALADTIFAIYHLEQIGPDQLVSELKQVFQPPLELMNSRVRLVPIERMQAVLGIAKNQADLELLEDWIRRMDVSSKSNGRRLYVYNVQNGNSKDLASALQMVLTGNSGAAKPATQVPTQPPASPPAAQGSDANQTVETSNSGDSQIANASNTSRIVSNDENNSLLIYGTEQEYKLVRDALAKLDVLPRQVMIEAILAEVTLNDSLSYGVQWFFKNGSSSSTFSANEAGSVSSQFPGFSYVYSNLADARVVINALQSKTDVKILSAPKLAVLNNQKATLQVGDEVPIRTQISQGTISAGSPIVSSIQMRETGVILEVIPRVNDNGNVILDVTQEVSEATSTTSSEIDSPTIQRRRLHTVVVTRDSATVAMGGLIRELASQINGGVPFLKDIPVVGNLFRTNTADSKRTELVVLLVPHVMRNHEETDAVVDSLVGSVNAAAEFATRAAKIEPRTNP